MKYNILSATFLVVSMFVLSGCDDYTVGVTTMFFSDKEITKKISPKMQELLALEDGDSRELMVKVWYPTKPEQDVSTKRHYGYHTEAHDYPVDPANEDTLYFLRENAQQSESYQEAEALNYWGYPVIFYSHGYGGTIEENEPYFEALVKKGYIVVSIGHTGEAGMVSLSSGDIVLASNELDEDLGLRRIPIEEQDPALKYAVENDEELAAIALGEPVPRDLLEKYHYQNGNVAIGAQEHLNLWVTDTHFVLSQLAMINRGDIKSDLQGIFDLERIGATGHSFGGATARRFCTEEPRCLASINMDGSSLALFDEKILRPHLEYSNDIEGTLAGFVREGEAQIDPEVYIRYFINKNHANINAATDDLYLMTLKSISHGDFAVGWLDFHDFGLGKKVWHPIIESTSVDFFDTYMKLDGAVKNICESLHSNENIINDFDNACS